jgi:hypothetical protein
MRMVWMLAALIASSTTSALAHHSIAGVYDSHQSVTVDGTVAEFHLVNPHPFLVVNVDAAGGTRDTWKLELDNRVELVDVGVTADTWKPGDRLVAKGIRARDGSRQLYAMRIDRRADGFWYEQVGTSPRIGRRP